tara:strand:+ start:63 stop:278 length:216 start_codon:yes stop_codon:yes gene_type:complete
MADLTTKILIDLDKYAPANDTPVGAAPDLTTWLARKIGQSRVLGTTSESTLYDGTDICEEVRNYLNGLSDP